MKIKQKEFNKFIELLKMVIKDFNGRKYENQKHLFLSYEQFVTPNNKTLVFGDTAFAKIYPGENRRYIEITEDDIKVFDGKNKNNEPK